jgi:hypothetical protein
MKSNPFTTIKQSTRMTPAEKLAMRTAVFERVYQTSESLKTSNTQPDSYRSMKLIPSPWYVAMGTLAAAAVVVVIMVGNLSHQKMPTDYATNSTTLIRDTTFASEQTDAAITEIKPTVNTAPLATNKSVAGPLPLAYSIPQQTSRETDSVFESRAISDPLPKDDVSTAATTTTSETYADEGKVMCYTKYTESLAAWNQRTMCAGEGSASQCSRYTSLIGSARTQLSGDRVRESDFQEAVDIVELLLADSEFMSIEQRNKIHEQNRTYCQ